MPEYREIGATGLKIQRGVVMEEYQPQLKGEKAVAVYREMGDNSGPVGALLFAIQMLLRAADWEVDPYAEDDTLPTPEDVARAEFVEQCMNDMSHTWEQHIVDALSFVQYGWSYFEICYKQRDGFKAGDGASSAYSDGRIGWRKLAVRSQDSLARWETDEQTGGIGGMWQRSADAGGEILIPIEKSLLYRASHQKNNPEGRSVLRTAYRPWHYARRIEEAEAIGIDRDLTGIPVIGVPPEILAGDSDESNLARNEWTAIGRNLRADEQAFVMKPNVYDESGHPLYTIDLLGTNARRLIDTNTVVARHERNIAMSVLADVILLGHEATGSYALSKTKDEMFTAALQGFLDEIAAVFRQYAVSRLFALNGFPLDRLPFVRPERIAKADLGAIATFVRDVGGAGLLEPDLDLENHLRELAGLPQRVDDGDSLLEGTLVAPGPGGRLPGSDNRTEAAGIEQ